MLQYFTHVYSLAAEKIKINESNVDLCRNSDVKKWNYVLYARERCFDLSVILFLSME